MYTYARVRFDAVVDRRRDKRTRRVDFSTHKMFRRPKPYCIIIIHVVVAAYLGLSLPTRPSVSGGKYRTVVLERGRRLVHRGRLVFGYTGSAISLRFVVRWRRRRRPLSEKRWIPPGGGKLIPAKLFNRRRSRRWSSPGRIPSAVFRLVVDLRITFTSENKRKTNVLNWP